MQPSTALPPLPFRKALRRGQQRVVELAECQQCGSLNIKLPTGYGKTLCAVCVYSRIKQLGRVDRLLYIVPTVAQLEQFVNDASNDMADAGVTGPLGIWRIDYSPAMSITRHRQNREQVFACTVQGLTNSRGAMWDVVTNMLSSSRWMIVIDEYHHYGIDAHWGQRALQLPCVLRLAMSATPYRKDADSAFGKPDMGVKYLDALEEGCVKALYCHSYIYKIDAVLPDGQVKTYTTDELISEAGSDNPDAIEHMKIQRKMRWSPKYVSPLIDVPLARLQRKRIETGLKLQMIVGTMCCSHAELVCEQIRGMFPEYRVDWVGTGDFGRPPDVNEAVINKFCPKKVDGQRRSQDIALDILVHVAKAGEGLDSVFVTEVVHLNAANITNQNNQENGRASRVMPELPPAAQRAYINVDSSSPFAKYPGRRVMELMDNDAGPTQEIDDVPQPDETDDGSDTPIPEEPTIYIENMELLKIEKGDPEVQRYAKALVATGSVAATYDDLKDLNHWIHDVARDAYRDMRRREAEEFNPTSVLAQWREKVSEGVGHVAWLYARRITLKGVRFERSLIGDIKTRINQRKHKLFGSVKTSDLDNLKLQYAWVQKLDREVIETGVPEWLR